MSKMMRISEDTAKNLDRLAKEMGKSKQAILEKALQILVREQFVLKANAEYAMLKKDKKAWAKYTKEMKEWDITLEDGLSNFE